MRILAAARARLRRGEPLHEITLTDLADDCGVTRAAAAFHYRDGVREVVAGLAMEFALKLLRRVEAIPAPVARDGSALPAATAAVFASLLDDPETATAIQSVRWGWRVTAQDAVLQGLNRALSALELRLPPGLHPRLVLGVAEYFFGEVLRETMSRRTAERSLLDTLERISAPD